MDYQQITIPTSDTTIHEILIALLSDKGYEGFEETPDTLIAFIDSGNFDVSTLAQVLQPYGLEYTATGIEKQNWNAVWESNFPPVVVADFCTVRAPFHNIAVATPHEIIITPKMSFGTGHHATTQLMMELMRSLDLEGKSVLDFGAGTGILSILAAKLRAGKVVAADHEEWAAENAVENAVVNGVPEIEVILGSLENVRPEDHDIILANINRHILLQYMSDMVKLLSPLGTILMSGILTEDEEIIRDAAEEAGLALTDKLELNNWIALRFTGK